MLAPPGGGGRGYEGVRGVEGGKELHLCSTVLLCRMMVKIHIHQTRTHKTRL